jgi:Anti-sigma-K factor rskA
LQINDIISSGLLELYVLGLTNEQETAQVLAWKATYPEVGVELLAIENSLEQVDLAKAVSPSLDTKKNLFSAIKSNKVENVEKDAEISTPVVAMNNAVVKPMSNTLKYAAAAAAILFVVSAINNFSTYTKYKKATDALAVAEQKINNQNQELASLKDNLEVPLNISSQQVVLKGTATAPTSTAKIFWIRNTGDVYVEASGLPETPTGMQYQLWAIIDGKPVDAGMINNNKKGQKYNIQKMKAFGKAQAFAITLEKEGGSPTPTMEKMYVMSEI